MARSFNGSSDLIKIGGVGASPIPSASDCSLSIWSYQTVTSAGTLELIGIFDNSGAGTNSLYVAMGNGSALTCNIINFKGGAFTATGASSTISLNVWNHWLGVFFNATGAAILYLNGVKTATGTLNSGLPATTSAGIGAITSSGAGTSFFTGRLAEAAMWTAALTAAEAMALSSGALPNNIRPSNLVAYLPIDGLQSPEPDFSGFQNNGVVTGTATAPGPPVMMFTPRWPQGGILTSTTAAPASTVNFRRTLSLVGTRAGSRQVMQ